MSQPPRLADVRARLDALVNHEATANSTIAAGRVAGLSLSRMEELCGLLGDPHRAFPSIHVTGTNGKGTVVRTVAAILGACDLSVGTTTSPHLERLNERIERNLQSISDEELADVVDRVLAVGDLMADQPTWFEVVTAAAFTWFADVAVDVAVVEVGLLGRYDATNVIDASVAVITSVDADHTDFAGDWRAAVMTEKAGIIGPDTTCVLGDMDDQLASVAEAEGPRAMVRFGRDVTLVENLVAVGGRSISVETSRGRYDEMFVPLHGAHQAVNVALGIAAAEEFFDRALDPDLVEAALAEVSLPGRCEVLCHDPLLIVDGAHNEPAGHALARTLTEEFVTIGSRVLVVGVLRGRDPEAFLASLAPVGFDTVVVTTPPSPRALPADELAVAARALNLEVEVIAEAADAVAIMAQRMGEDDLVVVTGSFAMIQPARVAVRSERS